MGLLQFPRPHPSSVLDSEDSSAVIRFWVAAVSSEIAVTAEDMVELNSDTKTDAAAPVLVLVLFAGPLPGVFPGLQVANAWPFGQG